MKYGKVGMEATGGKANNKAGLKCEVEGQSCEFNVTGGAWQNAVYHITFPGYKPPPVEPLPKFNTKFIGVFHDKNDRAMPASSFKGSDWKSNL